MATYAVRMKPKEMLKFAITYTNFYSELPKPYNGLSDWSEEDLDNRELQQFAINYLFYTHNEEVITAMHIAESGFHFEIPFKNILGNDEILMTFPHWSYFANEDDMLSLASEIIHLYEQEYAP